MSLLSILLLLTAVYGCFFYSVRIELSPSPEALAELTASEVTRVVEIVEKTVSALGFLPNPRLAEIQRSSRNDAEWDKFVVASYYASSYASTSNRVRVSVFVYKVSRRCCVSIRDLDSVGKRTRFTSSLERSLLEALSSEFPTRRVVVEERGGMGPSLFGP